MSKSAALERATCESCGTAFTRAPGEDWKRLCLSCWKASPAPSRVFYERGCECETLVIGQRTGQQIGQPIEVRSRVRAAVRTEIGGQSAEESALQEARARARTLSHVKARPAHRAR